jgi:isoquinoline 1-oxidoreductase beta subunit
MHSVFWTLAKSHNRMPSGQRRANALPWENDVATDMRPEAGQDGTADYSYNAFIQESTLDEIAFIGGADPLELRRKLMSPYPVATRLIDAVDSMSGWQAALPDGKARGFAFALSFGTWLATVVQVSEEAAGLRIEKVFCAADPGFVRDERSFRAELTSAIRSGLSAAIGFDGAAAYREPEIELDLLRNSTHLGSNGKLIVPPVASALANAVFALTGKRLRSVPLSDEVNFV